MQIKIFFSALNIDDLGKKWGIRIVFLLLTLGNFFYLMFPIGDSDLTNVMNWYEEMFTNPEKYMMSDELLLPPFTTGNIMYLLSAVVFLMVMIIVAICYAAAYVYFKRPDKGAVGVGKVLSRTSLMCLFFIVIYPVFLLFLSGMSFVFVAVLPILSIILCSFISGDYSFGKSFANGFKMLRGNYLSVLLNFIFVYFILSSLKYGVDIFHASGAYYSIVCVLAGALQTYSYLVLGRLMGTLYIDAKYLNNNKIVVRNNNINF